MYDVVVSVYDMLCVYDVLLVWFLYVQWSMGCGAKHHSNSHICHYESLLLDHLSQSTRPCVIDWNVCLHLFSMFCVCHCLFSIFCILPVTVLYDVITDVIVPCYAVCILYAYSCIVVILRLIILHSSFILFLFYSCCIVFSSHYRTVSIQHQTPTLGFVFIAKDHHHVSSFISSVQHQNSNIQ
jgi:hypothetical protein